MKKFYLVFIALVCSVSMLAQPTLQYPDNVPQVGDVFQIQFVSNDGLTTLPVGANVSWDYSGIAATFGGEITTIDPSQAPAGDDFPQANMVLNMGDTIYTYAMADANGYYYLGSQSTSGSFPSLLIYSDSRTFLSFPFTYLDTHNDTYKGVVTTSVADVHVTATSEMIADAYGTLILPTGTYNNVLRTVTVDAELDSVFVGGVFVKAFTIVRTQFSWLQDDSKGPLMSIEILSNTFAGTVDTVAYYVTSGSGIGDTRDNPFSQLDIYPNPAEDHLTIEYQTSPNLSTTISIVNHVGQIMQSQLLHGDSKGYISKKLDISTLPSGLYFVNVSCDCGAQVTEKIVIR